MLYQSQARIDSPSAGLYLSRLCQHWGRSARVLYDGQQGLVLSERSRHILRLEGDHLDITLQSFNPIELDELERRVGSQLSGLLYRPGRTIDWKRKT
ncbi:DUF2218 domain-containing protein [Pseudomonas citronellolis]|uniref:DUF2218 domain-containing protein n=1 Tax=Pseudomonas citronellolis TaxID=53408 RepID=UPI0009E78BE0|nr:DUF2218 domain-containing protein [Pseudomonas citronellolis]MCP1605994.1 hypothetical protein [Pseudomonas citronellolis]MCP1656596.1 hypothetical protein [Pseudomonas citronellolis]MCP1723625.1 hypothetical protein [Pseudomonas citronellolis]